MGTIRLYWWIVPVRYRRRCLFRKSCSRHVYEKTLKRGFVAGIKALGQRWRSCRPGYRLDLAGDMIRVRLVDGTLVEREEMSEIAFRPSTRARDGLRAKPSG